jgi:hypothetical protein
MIRLLLALLFVPALLLADVGSVNNSSFTRTNEARANIPARILDKVIVGVASSGGTLLIWSSTSTTAGSLTDAVLVSSITLGTAAMFDFNDVKVRGITYQTNGATNGVTILYKN